MSRLPRGSISERLKAENAELKKRLGIAEPENAESLENCGINVRYKSDFHQKFTIIDNQTVWYGSVNFLSFGTHDESIMRFQNTEIAGAVPLFVHCGVDEGFPA